MESLRIDQVRTNIKKAGPKKREEILYKTIDGGNLDYHPKNRPK